VNDYSDAKTCECGALIECLDGGNGYYYWVHVKQMRIAYDHAAVPARVESKPVVGSLTPTDDELAEARSRTARWAAIGTPFAGIGSAQAYLDAAADAADEGNAVMRDARIRKARALVQAMVEAVGGAQ
jgi:hypothetical protein